MADHEVTELTWENGQLAIHGLNGLLPNKPNWGRANDTLESIVHQATSNYNNHNSEPLLSHQHYQFDPTNTSSTFSFSIGNPEFTHVESRLVNKRMRLEPDRCRGNFESNFQEERRSPCAGGSAARNEDSDCHDGSEIKKDQEDQQETKGETSRSKSTRPNRAAANHNQSERRRRDRINQKMKALQRLVPNASQSDKASMLDEVIEYLKKLKEQVKMMNTRSLPQMMIPALEMQQHMQMAMLARMGMGVGIGTQPPPQVISPAQIASDATSQFFSPPFMMPQMMTNYSPNAAMTNNSASINNPYFPYFSHQSMNMDLYTKMAAIYQQQLNQTNQQTSNYLPHDNVERR